MASNFYEELANRNFYEKTASSHDQIKSALNTFTTEEMDAIAEELGLIGQEKIAEESEGGSLESKVLTQVEKKEQEDKRDKANEAKVEGGESKTEESQTVEGGEAAVESKTKEEKKEVVNPQAAESAGTSEGANTQTSGDATASNNTGSDVTDEQKVAMVLQAYDLAAEKLASEGYSLADYVYSKVGNEKVAFQIAENAEKLAFVTEQNCLKVADDIIETVFNLVQE